MGQVLTFNHNRLVNAATSNVALKHCSQIANILIVFVITGKDRRVARRNLCEIIDCRVCRISQSYANTRADFKIIDCRNAGIGPVLDDCTLRIDRSGHS